MPLGKLLSELFSKLQNFEFFLRKFKKSCKIVWNVWKSVRVEFRSLKFRINMLGNESTNKTASSEIEISLIAKLKSERNRFCYWNRFSILLVAYGSTLCNWKKSPKIQLEIFVFVNFLHTNKVTSVFDLKKYFHAVQFWF